MFNTTTWLEKPLFCESNLLLFLGDGDLLFLRVERDLFFLCGLGERMFFPLLLDLDLFAMGERERLLGFLSNLFPLGCDRLLLRGEGDLLGYILSAKLSNTL